LIFDSRIINGQLKIFVIRSFLPDISVGDELIKINGQHALKYVNAVSKEYMKGTCSPMTNLKKFILYMCILNPLNRIDRITVLSNKDIGTTYADVIKSPKNKNKRIYTKTKEGRYIQLINIAYFPAKPRFFAGFDNIFDLIKN
jgi:hypothetical protein